MGCFYLYLVPTTDVRAPRPSALDAASLLLQAGIIWAKPRSEAEIAPGHFAYGCGENAGSVVDVDGDAGRPAFETCYLFGSERPAIVPQCAGVEPKCPK